jgi:CRP-like cAMP-binding protein
MAAHVTAVEGNVHQGWRALQDRVWLPILADVPLFRSLSKRHLRRIAAVTELRRFADGTLVIRAGARGDAFHVVLDGTAVILPVHGEPTRLRPGEYFGELALLDGAPRSATIVAGDELTTARIGRDAFDRLLREEPVIAAGLARGLVGIVRELQGEGSRQVQAASRLAEEQAGTALDLGGSLGFRSLLFEVPLFKPVSRRHLGKLAKLARMKRFHSKETVVSAGSPGDAFYVILDGHAEVRTPEGKTRKLGPGDFFGELALIDGAPRSATVTATDELTVDRLARSGFQRMLREDPSVAVGLDRGLVAIIRGLQ